MIPTKGVLMRTTLPWLGALVAATLLAPAARAQCCYYPPPQAPDACGPGLSYTDNRGCTYCGIHCVYPPFPPFNGMVCGPNNQGGAGGPGGPGGPGGMGGSPAFPSHPFARGPRDYFMVGEPDYFSAGQY